MSENKDSDLHAYRVGRLSILELLTFLIVLGMLLIWVCKHYFIA